MIANILKMDSFLLLLLMFAMYSSLSIIMNKNILVSVLFLILLFILMTLLYIYLGAEFLGFLLLIVYVGAISILFLFVIMLLDIRIVELQNTFFNYFSICFIMGFFFLSNIYFVFEGLFDFLFDSLFFKNDFITYNIGTYKTNLQLFGEVLYNHLFFFAYVVVYYLLIVLLIVLLLIFNRNFSDFFFCNRKILHS